HRIAEGAFIAATRAHDLATFAARAASRQPNGEQSDEVYAKVYARLDGPALEQRETECEAAHNKVLERLVATKPTTVREVMLKMRSTWDDGIAVTTVFDSAIADLQRVTKIRLDDQRPGAL
ncbi:MAG: hypothetical protein ACE5Q3_07490, partial [Alphaproteobacteria bacterium]